MKYEKAFVTLIDLGEDQIIATSGGISDGCGDAASQYAEAWVTDCNNPNHKTPCTNKSHRGENL